jgi:hypothetical protein
VGAGSPATKYGRLFQFGLALSTGSALGCVDWGMWGILYLRRPWFLVAASSGLMGGRSSPCSANVGHGGSQERTEA